MEERGDDVELVERVLRTALDRAVPERIREALLHAVFAGGARVRPRLTLAVARAAGAAAPSPLAHAMAAAVELLHCASLVHDDLPCFDDAETRRGRPTVHRAYGEATAVLVGDALIVAAFETLARAGAPGSALLALARAAGAQGGLVSGQALELEDRPVDVTTYHGAKTAALFEAAAVLGAESVGANAAPFATLGRSIGLFYQLVDDAADVFGDASVLGKPIGRDEAHERPSAMASIAPGEAARRLHQTSANVLTLVPACPGHDELRGFLSLVFGTLIARTGVAGAAALLDDERAAE